MASLKKTSANMPPASIVPVLIFTGLYMAAAIVGAVLTGNREFVFYLAVMAVLIGLIFWVHRRINLTILTLWALSLWGLMHMAGGLLTLPAGWPHQPPSPVLYNAWLIPGYFKYDQLVHAYGFGVTTWVCFQGLQAIVLARGISLQPTLGALTLSAMAGMGFGALNEIIEFIAVLLIPNTNVGGYINTGWDLVANASGCLIAALLIRKLQWR